MCIYVCTYIRYTYVASHKFTALVTFTYSYALRYEVIHITSYVRMFCNIYLIQKHPECKKRSGQELEKGQDEKELKSKWAAKADVVLVLMRIKF